MPRRSSPASSPAVLLGILAGSAIAVSGLVAAGVIVFVFGGGRPVAPPAATVATPPEPAAREVARPPKAAPTTSPQAAAGAGPKRAPEAAPPPAAASQSVRPEPPVAVAATGLDEVMNDAAQPEATRPARDAEPAAAAQAAVDPEPPPSPADDSAADPEATAVAAAAAVVAALPEAIDIIPAKVALGVRGKSAVDLGPCAPEAAAVLEMAIAQPVEQGPDEVGRLRVSPAEPAADGWRIDQLEPGLDKEVPRSVATVAVRDDRLTASASPSLPPGTARMLARSVLLVRVRGAGDWKPVRLVRPGAVGSLRFPALGEERERMPLPLPPPFAGQGLPPGSFLALEINTGDEQKLVLEPPRDRPDESFGMEHVQGELTDGTKVVVRIRIEPQHGEERQPLLLAEMGIGGLEGKRSHERQRLGKLMALGKTHQKVLADTLAGWDKAVEALIRKPVDGLRPGEAETLLGAPLPMSQRLPPIPVSLQPLGKEFDDFLIRTANARQDGFRASSDLPGSLADWDGDCRQVIRNASSYYPSYVQREWADHFQRPLQAWWDDYRPKAVAAVTEATEAVAKLAAGNAVIHVKVVAVNAIGPEGKRYVVPLLEWVDDPGGKTSRAGAAGDRRPTGTD